MADEVTNAIPAEAPATETQAPAPSAETKNTDSQAEPMIPKSRLDEVLAKLKSFESEKAKAEKAAKDAEAARLAEQGNYKELFEKQQAELETERTARKQHELKLLQRDAAAQTNLPVALAERLKGETLEEMVADAKAILAVLPKPQAPNVNASSGDGAAPKGGARSEDEKQRLADRFGVKSGLIQ